MRGARKGPPRCDTRLLPTNEDKRGVLEDPKPANRTLRPNKTTKRGEIPSPSEGTVRLIKPLTEKRDRRRKIEESAGSAGVLGKERRPIADLSEKGREFNEYPVPARTQRKSSRRRSTQQGRLASKTETQRDSVPIKKSPNDGITGERGA